MKSMTTKRIIENATGLALLESKREYREKAASFIVAHKKRASVIRNGKNNIPPLSMLVVGPTGVGKTYVFYQLAKTVDVKIVVIDCSSLSRVGWKGIR